MRGAKYDVSVGDKIRILRLYDPYSYDYPGRVGIVTSIDDAGQLHGTRGGLAVIPGEDEFEII